MAVLRPTRSKWAHDTRQPLGSTDLERRVQFDARLREVSAKLEARAEAAKLLAAIPDYAVAHARKSGMGRADAKFGHPYINCLLVAGLPE